MVKYSLFIQIYFIIITFSQTVPLKETLHQYAEDIGIERKKLVFEFDGERVNDESTPQDLELEDDFCIDVKRKKPKWFVGWIKFIR